MTTKLQFIIIIIIIIIIITNVSYCPRLHGRHTVFVTQTGIQIAPAKCVHCYRIMPPFTVTIASGRFICAVAVLNTRVALVQCLKVEARFENWSVGPMQPTIAFMKACCYREMKVDCNLRSVASVFMCVCVCVCGGGWVGGGRGMVKGRVASENLPILPGVCSFHWIRYDWGSPFYSCCMHCFHQWRASRCHAIGGVLVLWKSDRIVSWIYSLWNFMSCLDFK